MMIVIRQIAYIFQSILKQVRDELRGAATLNKLYHYFFLFSLRSKAADKNR
jgi:hypothetical protein